MLVSSCSPDWGHVKRFATDLDLKLDEDTSLLTEKLFLGLKPVWLIARGGTGRELTSQSPLRVSVILRPCVLGRIGKTKTKSFNDLRCYDLVRQKVSPTPFGEKAVRLTFDVLSSRIWYRSTQWLDKIERKLLWSCYGSGAERPLDW